MLDRGAGPADAHPARSLAAASESEWDHFGEAAAWSTFDPTGERRTMEVLTGSPPGGDRGGPRPITSVSFFDDKENQREWNVEPGHGIESRR